MTIVIQSFSPRTNSRGIFIYSVLTVVSFVLVLAHTCAHSAREYLYYRPDCKVLIFIVSRLQWTCFAVLIASVQQNSTAIIIFSLVVYRGTSLDDGGLCCAFRTSGWTLTRCSVGYIQQKYVCIYITLNGGADRLKF